MKISLVEQMIMNEDRMGVIKGWRAYRIEYEREGSSPEGMIYLPPEFDPETMENLLNRSLLNLSV